MCACVYLLLASLRSLACCFWLAGSGLFVVLFPSLSLSALHPASALAAPRGSPLAAAQLVFRCLRSRLLLCAEEENETEGNPALCAGGREGSAALSSLFAFSFYFSFFLLERVSFLLSSIFFCVA